jgi:hypothetical protein
MKLVFSVAAALAACTGPSIGTASITRGAVPFAQSAYAVTFEATTDRVPSYGWELRLGFDAPGTACDQEAPWNEHTSVVLALANLATSPPVLPIQTIPMAAGPPPVITTTIVGYYADVDPMWTLDSGTIELSAASKKGIAGTITATAHRGSETADLAGAFDAPLCPGAIDRFDITP